MAAAAAAAACNVAVPGYPSTMPYLQNPGLLYCCTVVSLPYGNICTTRRHSLVRLAGGEAFQHGRVQEAGVVEAFGRRRCATHIVTTVRSRRLRFHFLPHERKHGRRAAPVQVQYTSRHVTSRHVASRPITWYITWYTTCMEQRMVHHPVHGNCGYSKSWQQSRQHF